MKKLFLVLLFMVEVLSAYEASFDCSKANLTIEKIICSDTILASKDKELSKTYSIKRDSISVKYENEFVKEQRRWLKQRKKDCKVPSRYKNISKKVVECLISQYTTREEEIKEWKSVSTYKYFKIKNLSTDEQRNFPLILNSSNAAKKINRYMQKNVLKNEFRIKNKKLIKVENQEHAIVSYLIFPTNNEIFSIYFSNTYSGEDEDSYIYNFDTQNGKLITLYTLFTKDGLKNIKRILKNKRAKRLDKVIKSLKITEDNLDSVEHEKEMLERCKDWNFDTYFDIGDGQKLYSFYIVNDNIVFKGDRCGGNDYAVSDIYKLYLLKHKDIKHYLSSYGKKLFKNKLSFKPIIDCKKTTNENEKKMCVCEEFEISNLTISYSYHIFLSKSSSSIKQSLKKQKDQMFKDINSSFKEYGDGGLDNAISSYGIGIIFLEDIFYDKN